MFFRNEATEGRVLEVSSEQARMSEKGRVFEAWCLANDFKQKREEGVQEKETKV